MENHNLDIDREAESHGFENAQPIFDITVAKDSIIPTLKSNIDTLIYALEMGQIDGLDLFATFKRIEKLFDSAKKQVEATAMKEADLRTEKTFIIQGVTFTKREGSSSIDPLEDDVYASLSEKLKSRKALLDLASKSTDDIYDSDGVQVPKLGKSKFTKSSLSVKF